MNQTTDELKSTIQQIIAKACTLKNKYTNEKNAPVNYACIFSQSNEEYKELLELASKLGKIIKETSTGPLFHIQSLETNSGKLKLLKIRKPDKTRPERGDADFTVSDYQAFKEKYLVKKGFRLIEREDFEMIELKDQEFDVIAYFSHPPLDEQLGLRQLATYLNLFFLPFL